MNCFRILLQKDCVIVGKNIALPNNFPIQLSNTPTPMIWEQHSVGDRALVEGVATIALSQGMVLAFTSIDSYIIGTT